VPAYLNNAATTDTYTDPNTVVFAYGRKSFSAQVSNGSIFYTLGYVRPGARALDWMPEEHYTVQALLTFADVEGEGLPPGSSFGGIKVRSGATGKPARVTVS
jgi:hypothetical protein